MYNADWRYMTMNEYEIIRLENSLIDFFLDEYGYNRGARDNSIMYRYRGLKIGIYFRAFPTEAFYIRIGMMEAVFILKNGEKILGSLGGNDERIVQKWLNRADNKDVLIKIWLTSAKPEKLDKNKKSETQSSLLGRNEVVDE